MNSTSVASSVTFSQRSSSENSSFTPMTSLFYTSTVMISSHSLIAEMNSLSYSLSNLDTSSRITEVSRSPVFTTVAHSPSFTQISPHISPLVTRTDSLCSQPVAGHSAVSLSLSPLVNPLHQSGTGYSLSPLVRPLNHHLSLNPLVNSSAACRSSLVNSSSRHSQLVNSSTANQLVNSLATSQSPSLLVNSTATGHPSCLLVNSSADGCSMLANADRLVFSTAVDHSSVLMNSFNQSVAHSSLVNSDYSLSNPLHQSAASHNSTAVSHLINTSAIGNSSSSLFDSLAAGHTPTVFVNVLHQPIASRSLIETTHPISSTGTSNPHSLTESTCSASSHQPTAASTVSQCDTLTELKNAVAGGNLLSIGVISYLKYLY